MARVRVEKVLEKSQHNSHALDDAMRRTFPDLEYNKHELYRNFKSALRRTCNSWETVSDTAVEKN